MPSIRGVIHRHLKELRELKNGFLVEVGRFTYVSKIVESPLGTPMLELQRFMDGECRPPSRAFLDFFSTCSYLGVHVVRYKGHRVIKLIGLDYPW